MSKLIVSELKDTHEWQRFKDPRLQHELDDIQRLSDAIEAFIDELGNLPEDGHEAESESESEDKFKDIILT